MNVSKQNKKKDDKKKGEWPKFYNEPSVLVSHFLFLSTSPGHVTGIIFAKVAKQG